MQHALLGLAIALIVAIVAALAAPAFVDWNDWRATFESRTTALVGAPVRIRGPIEATILPTPAFVLGDVEIGDPENASGIRAGEVRGILSLGALLRGVVEAEEFVLKRPALRLAIERGGRIVLPAMAAKPADADSLSISRITLEGGSLIVEDRATQGLLIFDVDSAVGELRSRAGPLKFEAGLRQNGRRWTLRANTGRFGDDNTSRLRLLLERTADGALIDADGTLALANAEPRFEGKITLARRGGSGLPWRIAADAKASGELVTLNSLVLALGAGEMPIELGGNVQFVPQPRGRIDGTLIARRLDLDRAAGIKNAQGLIPALAWAREALALIDGLPLAGRIGLAVESLAVGGNQVRDLNASLGIREGALALERIEARLPGRGSIKAAGSGAGGAIFSGDVTLEAEDAAAFAHWLMGGTKSAASEESGPLRLGGRVELAPGRVAIDKLDFAIGDAKLGGRLVLTASDGVRRPRIEADLNADGIDLDLLAPMAGVAMAGSDALDLQLGFKGRGLRVLGRPLRQIDVMLARSAAGVAIERLLIDDLDGLSATASGRIDAPWERANGRIKFEVAAARAQGLAAIVQALGGEDAAALTWWIAAGRPLKLAGAATGGGSVAGIAIEAEGRLAEFKARLSARIDPRTESLEEARIVLEARESGGLLAMLGLTPGPPVAGEGRLEFAASKPHAGALPVTFKLQVPDAVLTGEGEIRKPTGGRIEPRLNLRLEAADLRPLLAAAAPAGGEEAAPASVSARLTRAGDGVVFENIAAMIGGQRARGHILVTGFEHPKLSGKLEIARMELASVLGLALGRAGEGSSFWPEARLGTPPLAGATGTVEFAVGALELAGPLTATQAEFKLRLSENDAAIEDFAADLAGGKLSGQARFVRGDGLAIDGRIALGQFEVVRLLAPADWRSIARGRGNLALSFAGNGRTPAALAANLAGRGTLALEAIEIDGLDPGALAHVLAATANAEPLDEVGMLALFAPALAKGPLRLAKLEAPVVVAAGLARSGKARSQAGAVEVTAEGSFDLARLRFDAAIGLEGSAPAGVSVKPGATVRWHGPLGAPERAIEAAALATAITLRAMERDTRKSEAPERPPVRAPRSAEAPAALPEAALPKRVPLPPLRPRGPGASLGIAPPLPPQR